MRICLKISLLTCSLSLLGVQYLLAQQVDTVNIQAWASLPLQPGHRYVQVDSLAKVEFEGQSLSDLLSAQSDVFVKSYGQGSLATTSLRGGGASHTALIWNGISLQSSMNGQLDLSLLPAFFLDQVGIQYGGSANLYGSGAVGGALHLQNEPYFGMGPQLKVLGQIGSFDQYMLGGDVKLGGKRYYARTRLFTRTAQNDFAILGEEGRKQPHAALSQRGLLQEGAARINESQQLRLWLWTQQSERELPPPLTRDTSASFQQDEFLRLLASYEAKGEQIDWELKTAYMWEGLDFQDSLANIFSENGSQSLILEGQAKWKVSDRQQLHLGVNQTWQQAQADGYAEVIPDRSTGAAFISWKVQDRSQRSTAVLSARQGLTDGQLNPFLPSVSFSHTLHPRFSLKGQAGRTFRLPTFNDLYWNPGGNDSLKPELGWHQELGVYGDLSIGKAQFLWHATGFNQRIENWIFWRPGPDFWFPENLRTVWSRGLETEGTLRMGRGNWKSLIRLAYTYTRSTVVATSQARDRSVGQQLIYTPEHQGRVYARIQYRQTYFSYTHSLVGRRYTSTDNAFWLPGYQVGSLHLSREQTLPFVNLTLGFRINNIWNQSYQVIENRAMPGRNFLLTLSLTPIFSQPAD